MVLKDSETEEDIVNPHVTIYWPGEIRNWVTLNTHTFGESGERKLIDHTQALELEERLVPLFKVYASIRTKKKQDIFSDYPEVNIKMGYLLEGTIEELFPRSYNVLKERFRKMYPALSHFHI